MEKKKRYSHRARPSRRSSAQGNTRTASDVHEQTLGQLIMLLWCVDDVQDDTLPIQKNLGSRIIKYQLRSGGEDGINMN